MFQQPSAQHQNSMSRCGIPDVPTLLSNRQESLIRRPDTAYEAENGFHHDQTAAVQRLPYDTDTVTADFDAGADAPGMQVGDMQPACTSSYASGAANLQPEHRPSHCQRKSCHELIHEPVPPNKSKPRVQASPKTRVLAAKAWT